MVMTTARLSHLLAALACSTIAAAALAGCAADPPDSSEPIAAGQNADKSNHDGEDLFEEATFGGNGRSCGTCHGDKNGTLSPSDAQKAYHHDPNGPLFRSIDSDDGVGNSYTRLLAHATIRVVLNLPANVRLHDDPTARTVVLNRGIPTVENTPAIDPTHLMSDLREDNLQQQALDAVNAHLQPTVQPTAAQLDQIAGYEQTLFSSHTLRNYAGGGAAPTLPNGNTPSEKRGRAYFNSDGQCGTCHSGPMLNTTTDSDPTFGAGVQFNFVFAGFDDGLGFPPPPDQPNPTQLWDVDCPPYFSAVCEFPDSFGVVKNGNTVTIAMPDPGIMLTSGNPDDFILFKTPTLWNVKNTAPYFHDNSAATLEDVLSHYDKFFQAFGGQGLSAQDQADIIAFLKLL
jgi:cytochrome c peroxidase